MCVCGCRAENLPGKGCRDTISSGRPSSRPRALTSSLWKSFRGSMTFPCGATGGVRTSARVQPSKAAKAPYLVPEFADELSVVVVRLDDVGLAAGQVGGALDQIRPQGSLGQQNLLRLQVHLADHLVSHLRRRTNAVSVRPRRRGRRRQPARTLTNVSPMIFLFSSGLVVMFRVLLMRFRGVLSSSEMGRVVVPL